MHQLVLTMGGKNDYTTELEHTLTATVAKSWVYQDYTHVDSHTHCILEVSFSGFSVDSCVLLPTDCSHARARTWCWSVIAMCSSRWEANRNAILTKEYLIFPCGMAWDKKLTRSLTHSKMKGQHILVVSKFPTYQLFTVVTLHLAAHMYSTD